MSLLTRSLRLMLLVLLYSTCPLSGQEQTRDARGTLFWFGFMENLSLAFNGPPRFAVVIHADETSEGAVSIPATGVTIPFRVEGGSSSEVFLPETILYPMGSDVFADLAIRIESDRPVTAHAMHYRLYFTESTLLLPVSELDASYLVLAGRDQRNETPSAFLAAAGAEGAILEINPSTTTLSGRPANTAYRVELGPWQVYQVQARGDLSGSSVRETRGRPVALFSGALRALTVDGAAADNHLYDQNYPLASWGESYFVVPILDRGGDPVKILARDDHSIVKIGCIETIELDAGEYYETIIAEPLCISASGPIAVAQFNKPQSAGAPLELGDPTMLMLPPAGLMLRTAGFIAPGSVRDDWRPISRHIITLISPSEHIGSVRLDGIAIAGAFEAFADVPEFSFARIVVKAGEHRIAAPQGVQAYVIGLGDFDAYSHALGFDLVLPVAKAELAEQEHRICRGESLQLEAVEGFDSYHWAPAAGLNDPTRRNPIATPSETTTYRLTVVKDGCEQFSDVTVVVLPDLRLALTLPDTTAQGGRKIALPLSLGDIPEDRLPLSIRRAELDIRFNGFVFLPERVSGGTFTLHEDRDGFKLLRLQLRDIVLRATSQTLALIEGYGMFSAESDFSALEIDNLSWESDACTLSAETDNGSLRITGCRLHFHNLRLFRPSAIIVSSDEGNDVSTISVESGEGGVFRLRMISAQARVVLEESWHQQGMAAENARRDIAVPHDRYPAGWYQLMLETPSRTIVSGLMLLP